MKAICFTCGKETEKRSEFIPVTGKIGSNTICRECAAELGIKNKFSLKAAKTNTSLLKEYVNLHPEAQEKLDQHLELINKHKEQVKEQLADLKAEMQAKKAEANKHANCKKCKQTKCTCKSCGNIFYYSGTDTLKNLGNFMTGSIYSMNQVKDYSKCPKCGSVAIAKKDVFFWVDKSGNCVDIEE